MAESSVAVWCWFVAVKARKKIILSWTKFYPPDLKINGAEKNYDKDIFNPCGLHDLWMKKKIRGL